jgi:hypothetical protein
MRFKMIFLAAILLPAFGMAGCNGLRSLTEPPDGLTGPYTFSMATSMSNSSGAPTILEAQIIIDNDVVADSCPEEDLIPQTDADGNIVSYDCTAPAASTVTLSTEGHIGPGTHRVRFFLSSQTTTSTPTPYTVMAFTFRVCDAKGNLIKSISLPAQSARIGSTGQDSIDYTITI